MDKKHNEIFEGLLPIGSVVTTKTGTKRVMIIGRGIDREDGQGYIDEVEIELEDKLSNYLRSGVTPVPEKR